MKIFLLIIILSIPLSVYSGTIIFNKNFGGSENDFAYSIQQTFDGGYIIAGQIDTYGVEGSQKLDMWIIKLDSLGNKQWDKTFGGRENDIAFSIQQTTDKGYIVAGSTSSFGKGYPSMWIIKLNTEGDSIWSKIFEGSIVSSAYSIRQTKDEGYIVAGSGKENILKLDRNGNKEWGKHYGWVFYSVIQTKDDGYFAAGDSIYQQLEWDYTPSLSTIKLDSTGNKEWINPLGNKFLGRANSVQQAEDGGYIIAGDSINTKSAAEHSHFSMAVKLAEDGKIRWKYFGNEYSSAQSIQQTTDKGYIIAGNKTDYEYGLDFLIVRLDENGNEEWVRTFGLNGGWEYASSIQQTSDNGYIVAGQTDSFGEGRYDMWILKLDENGNGDGPVGIFKPEFNALNKFSLAQNFPNPFNQSTTIGFYLPEPGYATITFYDIFGKKIDAIIMDHCPAGESHVEWNAKNLNGGIYFYRLKAGHFVETKSFILQK